MADSDESSAVRVFDVNGKPLHFFMRPCKERQDLRKIVEAHGGLLSGNRNAADIELYVAGDVCSNQEALPSMFVRDCVRAGRLLDAASYRKGYVSRLSGTDDADGKISDIEDDVAHNVQMEVQLHQTRRKYLLDEDMRIIAYVASHCHAHPVQGSTLWKNMELLQVTPHSWQSMKQRFKMQIMPYIHGYDVSDVVKRTIAALGSTVGSSSGPFPPGIPDLSDSDDEAYPLRPDLAASRSDADKRSTVKSLCTFQPQDDRSSSSSAKLRSFAGATSEDHTVGDPATAGSVATAARAKHSASAEIMGADDTADTTLTPIAHEPGGRCSTTVADRHLPQPVSVSPASSRVTIVTASSVAAAARPAARALNPCTDGQRTAQPSTFAVAAGASDRTGRLLAESDLPTASGSMERTSGTDDSSSHVSASRSENRCISEHASSSEISQADPGEVELTQWQHGSSKKTAFVVGSQVRKRTSATSKQSGDCMSSSTSSEDDFDRVLIATASRARTGNSSRLLAASTIQSKRARILLTPGSSPSADSIPADLSIGGQSPDDNGTESARHQVASDDSVGDLQVAQAANAGEPSAGAEPAGDDLVISGSCCESETVDGYAHKQQHGSKPHQDQKVSIAGLPCDVCQSSSENLADGLLATDAPATARATADASAASPPAATSTALLPAKAPAEAVPVDPSPAMAKADSPAAASLAICSTTAALADAAAAAPMAVAAASLGVLPGESTSSGRAVESLIELISGDLKCSALEVVRTLYACNCDFKLAVQHLRSGSKGVFWSTLDDENIRQGRYDLLKGRYSNSDLIKRMEFLHRWDTY